MLDIKDFYLNTPMKCKEYMRLKITDIPDEIIMEYNLQELVTEDGYVYCAINKGMYGLPQAGIIAQELLTERLSKHGYHQSKIIPGLWTHETRPTAFTLVVDNFAIKIMSENNADQMINRITATGAYMRHRFSRALSVHLNDLKAVGVVGVIGIVGVVGIVGVYHKYSRID
jgi:hypothetical protein